MNNIPKEVITRKNEVTIIGIGGGAINILNRFSKEMPKNFNLISVNTDIQILANAQTEKILIGRNGLGCGGNPEAGKEAAEDSEMILAKIIKDSEKLILIACLGGGTGSGATPVIARIAKALGIEAQIIVTLPFSFEGKKRRLQAEEAIKELNKYGKVTVFENDEIQKRSDIHITMRDAFKIVDVAMSEKISEICKINN